MPTGTTYANANEYPYIRLSVTVEYNDIYTTASSFDVYFNDVIYRSFTLDAGSQTKTHVMYVERATAGVVDQFSTSFKIESTESGATWELQGVEWEAMTRQGLATACFDTYGFRTANRHPELQWDNSGFVEGGSDNLRIEFTVPRQTYGNTFKWTPSSETDNGGLVEATTNYDEAEQAVASPSVATLWETTRLTQPRRDAGDSTLSIAGDGSGVSSVDANCGNELWFASIPWTTFQNTWTETESFETFDESHGTVDSESSRYYVLTAEIEATQKEYLLSIREDLESGDNESGGRTWENERSSSFRYPMGMKFQRTIEINQSFVTQACTGEQTICTVRHVAAIVTYIQTRSYPVDGIASGTYGEVDIGIQTLTAYPYMFITGEDETDIGFNLSGEDQNSLNAGQSANGDDLNQEYSQVTNWGPPTVTYSGDYNIELPHNNGQIDFLQLEFSHESVKSSSGDISPGESCKHDVSLPVESQVGEECIQNWHLKLKPTNHDCYISGTYTIYFYARCFREKPVCVFVKDGDTYQNGVHTELTIESNNMCPELIEEVSLTGTLCATGVDLSAQVGAAGNVDYGYISYESECATDSSFIQGESVLFRMDLQSNTAALATTRIDEIYVCQDYTFNNDGDDTNSALIPRHDTNWECVDGNAVKIWDRATDDVTLATPVLFSDTECPDSNNPGANDCPSSDQLLIVEELRQTGDSKGDALDASDTLFAADEAGFKLKMSPWIFPTAHDHSSQLVFTAVASVVYTGFNTGAEGIPEEGVVSGQGFADAGTTDQNWCENQFASKYGTAANVADSLEQFCCDSHSSNNVYTHQSCPELCSAYNSSNCPDTDGGTRRRRNLQSTTIISGGVETFAMSTSVSIAPQKAQVNGRVDEDAELVRFVLSMKLNGYLNTLYNEDRPSFYDRMEYHLAGLVGSIPRAFKCSYVESSTPGVVNMVVDIKKVVASENYTPARSAAKLEIAISSGTLQDALFFQNVVVDSMSYQEIKLSGKDTVNSDIEVEASGVVAYSALVAFMIAVLLF